MADDDAAPAEKPAPFGGKAAPLFKKKGGPKKFLDDHKLAVISTLVAIIGLVYLVLHNRASSTSGSTSANVSGQSTAADNNPGTADSTSGLEASPYEMQPWWTGTDTGGGGGGLSTTTATPSTSTGTPPTKHPRPPAERGKAKPQPSSHPASTPATGGPATAAVKPHAAQLAALYAPLAPSSSPVHSVAPTAHPASHVAVGTSRNGSNVLVPFTFRAGTPAPGGHNLAPHAAAAAKRPAGRRIAGRA
jgi:hypothetical protein